MVQFIGRKRYRCMNGKKYLIMMILAGSLALGWGTAPLWGSPAAGLELTGDVRIADIQVEGLRRTRDTVILDLLDVRPGDVILAGELSGVMEQILQDILREEIFAGVELRLEETEGTGEEQEIILVVEAREKWTLIPLPFFATDGSSFQGGLILLESNLLGRNKQLITAAFARDTGFSGFVAYADPSIRGTRWTWRTSAGTGQAERKHVLPDGTVLRRYTANDTTFGLGGGYRFSRSLQAGVNGRVGFRQVEQFDLSLADPTMPDTGTRFETGVTMRYDGTERRSALRTGPLATIQGGVAFPESGATWSIESRGEYSLGVLGRNRLRLLADGGIGTNGVADQTVLSVRDGFRTLPYQNVVAQQWAAGALYADVPFLVFSWGSLVLSHYWEGGVFDAPAHEPVLYGGPGAAFRVLLAEVAIPALGIDVAWNLVDPGVVFSFSIGMQM